MQTKPAALVLLSTGSGLPAVHAAENSSGADTIEQPLPHRTTSKTNIDTSIPQPPSGKAESLQQRAAPDCDGSGPSAASVIPLLSRLVSIAATAHGHAMSEATGSKQHTTRGASFMSELSLRLSVIRTGLAMFLLASFLSATPPSFADSTALADPALKQAVEQMIDQYIRAHPEVIEQSLQTLEAKREAEENSRQKTAIANRQQDLLNDPSSPVSGNPKGDVTVVEFFDYRCGYCKRAAGAVTQLQHEDTRVRIVYKDFPILGEASELAAKAALASRVQGKHQAFHEALLAAKGDMTKDTILAVAAEVGLDAKRLEADMANPEWQMVIDRNRTLAKDLGISGTPGFIVGTELVPGALDLKGLKDLIVRAGHRAPY